MSKNTGKIKALQRAHKQKIEADLVRELSLKIHALPMEDGTISIMLGDSNMPNIQFTLTHDTILLAAEKAIRHAEKIEQSRTLEEKVTP